MEDQKAEDPRLWPTTATEAQEESSRAELLAELRSLRESLVMARAEIKRHLAAEAENASLLRSSQDLARALTWALQQAYRASTIRSEDS